VGIKGYPANGREEEAIREVKKAKEGFAWWAVKALCSSLLNGLRMH
jgi:hypothetical protein